VRPVVFFAALLAVGTAPAAERLPPPPKNYFNDYAQVVPGETEAALETKLETFDRETSTQIVVAVFPKMDTDTSIEDYSQRIFESWKIGRRELDNGAALFVFVQDRKLRIHTGYGLEGALPDILAKQIIDNEITPRFRVGDFGGGLTAGVDAMIAATRNEYKPNVRKPSPPAPGNAALPLLFIAIVMGLQLLTAFLPRRRAYGRRGVSNHGGWFIGGGGGGGFSGGGFSGGGGGFSGGGGSSGGGGASGSW
jgi:uncharacterized protein